MDLQTGLSVSYLNSVYVIIQYNEDTPPFSLFRSCGFKRKQGLEVLMMLKLID